MATATTVLNGDVTTNANFQAFASWIDTNIQAFGWIYTAQTGDIDPATVASPSQNAFAGFRVYKTDDGLTDVYLRLDYGKRSSVNGIMLKFQIGTSVNGSGVLGGQTSTATQQAPALTAGSTQQYMSGATGRLMICLNTHSDNGTLGAVGTAAFAIGRTCDATGTPDATGFEIFATTANVYDTSATFQAVPLSGTVPARETLTWPVFMSTTSPWVLGSNTLYGIPQLFDGNGGWNPTRHVACVDQANASASTGAVTTKTLTLYGISHTYLVTQTNTISQHNGSARAMLRYE